MNLGRYEVVRELGKGAMGIVYLARDPVIGRLVALKTIRLNDTGDADEVREFQQRFVREAQAAGILSHPAIVTVHDIGQDEEKGVSFIAMEYVEGPTLKEAIAQGKPLSHASIARILAQVADALDYAHSRGIVHRDVKPANIIICGEDRVKITDFGIAKIATEAVNLTTTGQFLGTPNYMSPEQVKGTAVDGRTDIFSLGVVLYECLTRRKPFGGDSLTTISYRIVHEPFATPHEIDPSIPQEFDEIVNRCLAKEPADRYQHARDVAAGLRAIAAGQPLPILPAADDVDPTVITGKGHIPTMEMPFPDAAAAAAPAGARKKTLDETLRRTMKRRIPAPVFIAVTVVLLAAFGATAGWIWSRRVPVPSVDTAQEARVARERALRVEAANLLEQGNVEGAYQKLLELRRLAPDSPEVARMIQQLEQIRGEQATVQQRIQQARAKFEEGKKLYEAGRYSSAIPLFEEAFNLDPSSVDTVNFLRMSREQLELRNLREGERLAAAEVRAAANAGQGAATLVVDYRGNLTDGLVMVTVDGEKIVHEELFDAGGIFRRRTPRPVNVTRDIPSGRHEVVVFAIVNGMRITERKVFQERFRSGSTHRIEIRFNQAARKFEITMS
ncbi:MAG: protein kinase domain-containing protein [Thermoanaerobaculia bacterium]